MKNEIYLYNIEVMNNFTSGDDMDVFASDEEAEAEERTEAEEKKEAILSFLKKKEYKFVWGNTQTKRNYIKIISLTLEGFNPSEISSIMKKKELYVLIAIERMVKLIKENLK